MFRNFTAIDVVGTVEASLLLSLVLFLPGYTIGWLSNAFDFRKRRFAMQAVLSTPLAVAILPILTYLLGRYPRVLWTLFAASWFGFIFLLFQIGRRSGRIRLHGVPRPVRIGIAFALAWAILAIASLADLQFHGRLYFSTAAYDNSTRAAFTAAASRSIPAANPFFATSPPTPLRYHYFWMMLCSLVTKLGNLNPRHALYGGTVWAGIALMSLIVISLRFFDRGRERIERKAVIACSLLLVTGLDILPTVYRYLCWRLVEPDMEWWNEQITSWVDALIWTPHHIMSVVACMVGFLILLQPFSTRSQRVVAILVAGLAFGSSAGLSTLVSFTFALFVLLWLPLAAQRKDWDEVVGLLAAGAIGLVVALPYLRTLVGSSGAGNGGLFITVQVRDFDFAIRIIASILHTTYHRVPFPNLTRLLLLPLNYFLELGFFFLVGILRIRSIRAGSTSMTRSEEAGWVIVATSFLVGSFLRSTTMSSNDLGWRCFLQAQLMLLLWAALMIHDWWSGEGPGLGRRKLMAGFAGILLALGLIGTVYQVAMLRAYPILADAGKVDSRNYSWLDQDGQLGERNFALRSVYDSLEATLPRDAIVQYNPNASEFIPHQLYSEHSAAMGLQLCGVVFGGNVSRCEGRMDSLAPLFNTPSAVESDELDQICRKYNIEIMLVDDRDGAWIDRESWVWTRTPLVANRHVRAFACGDLSQRERLALAH